MADDDVVASQTLSPVDHRGAGVSHHSHDARVNSLLQATLRLLSEHARAEVTMSMIATEAGISRAWLYKFFPDVTTIYLELLERYMPPFVVYSDLPGRVSGSSSSDLAARNVNLDRFLTAPVGLAAIAMYALNGGPHRDPGAVELRARILELIDRSIVEPVAHVGVDIEVVRVAALVWITSIFTLVQAVARGDVSHKAARRQLSFLADCLLNGVKDQIR